MTGTSGGAAFGAPTTPTSPAIPIRPTLAALFAVWESLEQLLGGLTPEQWSRPTCLPGWTVADVVAHLLGTEAMLAGEEPPTVTVDVARLPHVANDIAAVNEIWVESLRGTGPEVLLSRFAGLLQRRRGALAQLSQEDFDAPSWTPVGQATYGRFLQIRVYDCWMHEQDIRCALGLPGHEEGPAAAASLDEAVRALGYLIGKRAGAPAGSRVLLDLGGPLARRIAVEVRERARAVPALDGPPDVTVRMPAPLFLRLTGGRAVAAEETAAIETLGDRGLARSILDNLAFTV